MRNRALRSTTALLSALISVLPLTAQAQYYTTATIAAPPPLPTSGYATVLSHVPQAQLVEYQHKLTILQAIDTGNVPALQQHIANVRAWQAAGYYSPGPINLNFPDQAGNTPAMRASMRGNVDMMHALVSEGATLQGANHAGETVSSIAARYGHQPMQQYLASLTPMSAPAPASTMAAAAGTSTTTLVAGGAVAAAAIAGGAIALSGGGGGGSAPVDLAGTHPESVSVASFRTAEAQSQGGVLTIRSDAAYSRGYDGRIFDRDASGTLLSTTPSGFVKLAIMDSGVDITHPDLDGNVVAGSVTCTAASCLSGGLDTLGHGTNVAGIAVAERDGIGMHGVAPQAKFISVRVATAGGGFAPRSDITGIEYALSQNVQIINSSFGNDTITDYTPAQVRTYLNENGATTNRETTYQNMVSQDVINVWAAGNDGPTLDPSIQAALPIYFQGATAPAGISQVDYDLVNPNGYDWSNHWVAVVAVNNSLGLASYSQRCGVARDWCIAAPGDIASTTMDGGGYEATAGTSFSAPHVTGALATLMGAFPHLAPETALQILFETATDLGTPGVDDTFGHGLVNLDRATSPAAGGWTLATGAFSSANFAQSGFTASGPFGDAIARSDASLEFRDKYNKNYTVPLQALATGMQTRPGWLERMGFNDLLADATPMALGGDMQLRMTVEAVDDGDPTSGTEQMPVFTLTQTHAMTGGMQLDSSFGYRTNLATDMVAEPASRSTMEVLQNPYLAMNERTTSMRQTLRMPDSAYTLVAYQADLNDSPENYRYRFGQDKPVEGVYGGVRFQLGEGTELGLHQGVVYEEASMLGAESSGAFALGSATTMHAGLDVSHRVNSWLNLFARYDRGRTDAGTTSNSLVTDMGTLSTDSYAFGVGLNGMLDASDRFHFAFSQPMRINGGNAQMLLPVATTLRGDSVFENTSLNLTPSGREHNLRASYFLPLAAGSEFSFDGIWREDANHVAGENEAAVLTRYTLTF